MWLLSKFTAVPLFTIAGAVLCPSPARLVQGLAGALGFLVGGATGTVLDRAKKEAARLAVLRLLSEHIQSDLPVHSLRSLIEDERKRFGLAGEKPAAEAFEDNALGAMYEQVLNCLLEGPENDSTDLPLLKRLKAALDLDSIVVGEAHNRAARSLTMKGEKLEGEAMKRATDKLLFLSQRAFADEEVEEAEVFEMARVRKVLGITAVEARQRINAVSTALYQQNLSAVVDKVDGQTREALAGASAAFGLEEEEAARMNAETYRKIAVEQLQSGSLAPQGRTTLDQAREVLQLGDRAAAAAFLSVASPILRKDVEAAAARFREAPETVPEEASGLRKRCEELGLGAAALVSVAKEGVLAEIRKLYNQACKEARQNTKAALTTVDGMLAFSDVASKLLSDLEQSESAPLSLPVDANAARRIYGLFLERSLDGAESKSPEQLAHLLELSEEDEEQARIEVCQPRLEKLYTEMIDKAEANPAGTALVQMALGAEVKKLELPQDAIAETAMDVYKARLKPVSGRVLKAHEKAALDNARAFLELSEGDVRVPHIKAFGETYEASLLEAMGRGGVMTPEAREALEQLRERLGITEGDAKKIFYGVMQNRVQEMMKDVREAFEEATYTKEALTQIWKERGKDVGDDPSADGSGGELGIKDTPVLDGVRGFKLMTELVKLADFYVGNKVVVEEPNKPAEYPVTVGKMMEEKTKEEMYGIYAWNAVTCQDAASKDKWQTAKPHVGGILGMSPEQQEKVLVRMVSRWANMFIKQKIGEQGQLTEQDTGVLTDWVPMFFGIDKEVTKNMVQQTNKGILISKALRLLNQPHITPAEVQALREEVQTWDLVFEKDLELTRPQLRTFFRTEVTAALEDADLTLGQKEDKLEQGRESFGLDDAEAADELRELITARCQGCLVNAVGDLLQGNEEKAVKEMKRLELLAAFVEGQEGMEISADWEVAPEMRTKLVKLYASSPLGSDKKSPNVRLLESLLGLVPAAR